MTLKQPVRTLRCLAARLPWKLPLSPRAKKMIAAVTLMLIWITGPYLDRLRNESTLDAMRIAAPSDLDLSHAEATKFCFHHHLEPHNASAPLGAETQLQYTTTQRRRIYNLLLITSTTSASMLELHLASAYPYVDYFIMLEAPPQPPDTAAPERDQRPLPGAAADPPSLLDRQWPAQLAPYRPKLVRHRLSHHSRDARAGPDPDAAARNALATRVVPLLAGAQRVEPGDVLLVADADELVRPAALRALRHCRIPRRTTIRTRRYWYSFQYMRVGGSPGARPGPADDAAAAATDRLPHPDPAATPERRPSAGNEWWPHPQATVYTGADTLLPDELRKQRDLDEYVFGDGGWTCYLCDNTITETLAKLKKSGIVWTDGPRWKAAGRVVDRVMNGVDLIERSNLSRIDANPDLPPQLQANRARFPWLLDRDAAGPGAGFADFAAADLAAYRAAKAAVDAEPDFERTDAGLAFSRENTQDDEEGPPPPPPPPLSEEDRKFLEALQGPDPRATGLSAEELAILNSAAGIGPGHALGPPSTD